MIPIIYPYKVTSQSARTIRNFLKERSYETKLVYPDGNYHPKPNHFLIDWGNSTIPDWELDKVGNLLNHPCYIGGAVNKIDTFIKLKEVGVITPIYTTSPREAYQWLKQGKKIISRSTVTGHSGQGIEIITEEEELTSVPLYTQLIHPKREFRVYVFKGEVFEIREKIKVEEREPDYYHPQGLRSYVFSHVNGYRFRQVSHRYWDNRKYLTMREESIKSIAALGLDFGAVDVIYAIDQDKVYILEVNTAFGMEWTKTVEKFGNLLVSEIEKE